MGTLVAPREILQPRTLFFALSPISDFSDKGGRGVGQLKKNSDKGGGRIRHILTFLNKSEKYEELEKYLQFFSEYDTF